MLLRILRERLGAGLLDELDQGRKRRYLYPLDQHQSTLLIESLFGLAGEFAARLSVSLAPITDLLMPQVKHRDPRKGVCKVLNKATNADIVSLLSKVLVWNFSRARICLLSDVRVAF